MRYGYPYRVSEAPLYTFEAGSMRVLRTVLLLLTVVSVAGCVIVAAIEPDSWRSALVTAVALLLTYAFVWAILPSRYELSRTHIGIVFPWKTWHVALDSVAWIRAGNWWEAYGYYGMRFATKPGQSVVIRRKHPNLFMHPNLVISPENRDEFLRALHSLGTGIEVGVVS
jgi:hypothetical protein